MVCLFHKWDGCKCTKCGKTRDKNHQFIFVDAGETCWEKCRICGKTTGRRPAHQLIYLPDKKQEQCTRCGMMRIHARHEWIWHLYSCQDRCSLCGKTKEHHDYFPQKGRCISKCTVCGEEVERSHIYWWDQDHCIEKCIRCGYKRPRHRWALVGGVKDGCTCRICGASNENGVHDWDNWVTEGEYTHIKVCRLCGERDESEKVTLEEGEKIRRRAERELERAMEWNDSAYEMAAKGF